MVKLILWQNCAEKSSSSNLSLVVSGKVQSFVKWVLHAGIFQPVLDHNFLSGVYDLHINMDCFSPTRANTWSTSH